MPDNHIYFYIHKAIKGYGSLFLLSRRSSANFRKVPFLRYLRLEGNIWSTFFLNMLKLFWRNQFRPFNSLFCYQPCQETLRSVLYMHINISLLEALPLQTW